ncbi:MAG: HipA N-terminal domain-containing protein [Synechococcus lacustris]
MTVAAVELWGTRIGAVALTDSTGVAAFEYEPAFLASGIQLAPLMMPLEERVYSFPELPRRTFRGLPGLLADSLPDRFGNNLINAWLARQGRTPEASSRPRSRRPGMPPVCSIKRRCSSSTSARLSQRIRPAVDRAPGSS